MRFLITLLLAGIPVFALSNKITIYDSATVTHTAQPFTVSRPFAPGEFNGTTSWPRPYIDGVAATVWQCDIQNSDPVDGSIRQANITFFATIASGGSIDVDFRSHGSSSSGGTTPLTKSQMLSFNGSAWGSKITGTASGVVKSASARTILNAVSECPAGEYVPAGCFKYLLSGPAVTRIQLFGGTDNSFGWECDTAGTCPSVSPYTSTVWKTPSNPKYNSIHPIWVLTFYTGWSGVKEEVQWENVWFGRLQDQFADWEIFSGGAETTSRWTKSGDVFYAFRRAREIFWDGTTPPGWTSEYRRGYRIDYNRPYLLYSRTIPFFDPYVAALGATAAGYDYNSTAGNLDIVHNLGTAAKLQWCNATGTYCGPTPLSISAGGARPDIGMMSRAYSRYLVDFREDLYEVMIQLGEQSGAWPIHIRESDPSLTYTVGSGVKAFGKPLSLDARPLHSMQFSQVGVPAGSTLNFAIGEGVVGSITCVATNSAFRLGCTAIDGTQSFNRWQMDNSHFPRAAYLPFLISGDVYFLEEQAFSATQQMAAAAIGSNVTAGCVGNFTRHGESGAGNDWGVPHSSHNVRVEAWGTLHVGETVLSMPAGSADRQYYLSKLNKFVDSSRGLFGLTPTVGDYNGGGSAGDECPSGSYNAATATPWCWGRVDRGERKANPLALPTIQGSTIPGTGLNSTSACGSHEWFENYRRAVYGRLNDAGLTQFEPLVAATSKHLIKRIIQSNAKIATASDYDMAIRLSSGNPPVTVAESNSTVILDNTLRTSVDAVSLTLNVDDQYQSPNCSTGPNGPWIGGLTRLVIDPGLSTEEWVENSGTPSCQASGSRTLSLAKRGLYGTVAQSHLAGAIIRRGLLDNGSSAGISQSSGYANIQLTALSYAVPYSVPDEVTGAILTGKRAWNTAQSFASYRDYASSTACLMSTPSDNCQNLMWHIHPRHQIANVRTKIGAGQIQFWYTAPTMETCRVGVSLGAFPTSDDSADTASTGSSLDRTLTVTGLSSGTYFYRITCGPFGGTARATGSFSL